MQNRDTPALAFWGTGYLLGAVAAAMLGSGGTGNALVICISNALLCGAYGVMWGGSRSFEGRRVRAPLIAAGAAIWIAAFQLESFRASPPSCVALVSFIQAGYALLAARELWYARDRELISRWPTLALVVGHAGFLLARIPFATVVASSAAAGQPRSAVVLVMAAEALFVNFCLPFLRVAMSKERSELEQRKAALTDSLTGVANRRAFFDLGARLLARTIPTDARRRCSFSISIASRRSTTPPGTKPAMPCCGRLHGSSRGRCGAATCSAASAARNLPALCPMSRWRRPCRSPSDCVRPSG